MAKEKEHPILNHPRTPGKCPKCNHRIGYQPQIGACPESIHCPICGYRDFGQKMSHVDFDMLPDNRRPM